MAANATSAKLETIIAAINVDAGLLTEVSAAQRAAGVAAARKMNDVIGTIIEKLGVNADKIITPVELMAVSDAIRADAPLLATFLEGHGDDEGGVETGFHKVQNNGSSMLFQGDNFVNTTADAIYHTGLSYSGGRFVNEDGDQNERVADVAGWLNYFLNGTNTVFGGSGNDMLHSGLYSKALAGAANETFYGGGGNDKIWADVGNDIVSAGSGDDESGGGTGNDKMWGGTGADKLYGESGNDTLTGGTGNDSLGGGIGNDTMFGNEGVDKMWGDGGDDVMSGGADNDEMGGGDGLNKLDGGDGADKMHGGSGAEEFKGGAGGDTIYGGAASDRIFGELGNDKLSGGNGNDYIYGDAGNDELNGGEGADRMTGGTGADKIFLWDTYNATDTIVFRTGASGKTMDAMDRIEGFMSGEDKIDFSDLVGMKFTQLDYIGGGQASTYYDGHYLRIDTDGDGAGNMLIEFMWVDKIVASDILLA